MSEKMWIASNGTAAEPVKEIVKEQVTTSMHYIDRLEEFFITNGFEFLVAMIIFIAGYMIARLVRAFVKWMLERNRWKNRANYDPTVVLFTEQLVYYGILLLAVVAALHRIGVPETTFVAAIGGMGLAVGLALQTDLANFAAGLIILTFKPFKVGDYIQLAGSVDVVGNVERIGLFSTTIKNKEGRTLFVPNANVTKATIINSSTEPARFYRFDVGIGYDSDHHEAIRILQGIFMDSPFVMNKNDLEIGITSFGDNAVIISAFPKVRIAEGLQFNYWVMSEIKDRLDAANITRPYPQREMHMNYPDEGVKIKLVQSDVDHLKELLYQDKKEGN